MKLRELLTANENNSYFVYDDTVNTRYFSAWVNYTYDDEESVHYLFLLETWIRELEVVSMDGDDAKVDAFTPIQKACHSDSHYVVASFVKDVFATLNHGDNAHARVLCATLMPPAQEEEMQRESQIVKLISDVSCAIKDAQELLDYIVANYIDDIYTFSDILKRNTKKIYESIREIYKEEE